MGASARGRSASRWIAIGSISVLLVLGASGAAAVDSTPSSFQAVTPVRVFDTRTGAGGVPAAPLGPGAVLDVVIGGTNGIPGTAKAISLNVTVVSGTTSSYLTVWPTGDARPVASSLNWTGPAATANAVTVGLGTGGKVSIYNNTGIVHVLADAVGYYSAAVTGFGAATNTAAAGRGRDCTIGEIILSAGRVANGTPANGQLLPISQNTALFSLIGTDYGGDGRVTFALPDLRGVAPNKLTYSICIQGIYPATT